MKRKMRNAKRETLRPGVSARSEVLCFVLCVLSFLLPSCKRDDMADQVKLKPYAASAFFADGAAARPLVAHTVARSDDPAAPEPSPDIPAGIINIGTWQNPLPASTSFPFEITAADLKQGQRKFEIFCTPCHGLTGDGDGMIPQRGFTHPPTYHSDRLRNAPNSYFYNVMTNGLGAMYPYNDRIESDDRWRIVAYIRALQLSQNADPKSLPASDQQQLREMHP